MSFEDLPLHEDDTYTFAVFSTANGTQGHVVTRDNDYNEDAMIDTLTRQYQSPVAIEASLENLNVQESCILGIVFDNAQSITVKTKLDLQRLLYFSIPSSELQQVRSAVANSIPDFLKGTPGNIEHLPMLQRLFELYVELGEDDAAFQEAAKKETASMSEDKKAVCLAIFHIAITTITPIVKQKMILEN